MKQVWDGVVDPLIGIASDKINTKWGRRKPWMLTFIWPMFIFWVAMWIVPLEGRWESDVAVVTYYAVTVLLFSTLGSLVMVPYNAMIPDMATDYHSRTFIVFFTLIFGIIGGSVASVLWDTMVNAYSSNVGERRGYFYAAITLGLPIIAFMLVAIVAGKERKLKVVKEEPDANESKKQKLVALSKQISKDLGDILKFLPFIFLLGLNIITQVAGSFYMNNFILWIKYVRDEADQTSISLFVLQTSAALSLVFWAIFARLSGKISTYMVSSLFASVALLVLFLFPQSANGVYFLNVFCLSFGSSASNLVTFALMPDVVAMNEEVSGLRREGLFYSFFALTSKVAQGFASLFATYALSYSGYLNPTEQQEQGVTGQEPQVVTVLNFLVTLFPLVLRILGILTALGYWWSVKRLNISRTEVIASDKIPILQTDSANVIAATSSVPAM